MTQFHFTSWPDHGVPEYAGPILNYLCRIKSQMKLSWGPTLVHCRSAIARVGNGVLVRVSTLKICVLLGGFCHPVEYLSVQRWCGEDRHTHCH